MLLYIYIFEQESSLKIAWEYISKWFMFIVRFLVHTVSIKVPEISIFISWPKKHIIMASTLSIVAVWYILLYILRHIKGSFIATPLLVHSHKPVVHRFKPKAKCFFGLGWLRPLICPGNNHFCINHQIL